MNVGDRSRMDWDTNRLSSQTNGRITVKSVLGVVFKVLAGMAIAIAAVQVLALGAVILFCIIDYPAS